MLYIDFKILDHQKFEDLLKIYPVVSDIKAKGERKEIDFWIKLLPDYVKRYYRMRKLDRANTNFKNMVEYLQWGLEANLDDLKKTGEDIGRLDFSTGNYPYGGMDRLMVFVNAFDCRPIEIYNGFNVNSVSWISKFNFECQEILK